MINRPPREVFEACGRGLAERTRKQTGGTQAAVEYAELVTNGFPLETPMLVEAVEAHRLLDAAVVRNGMETVELRISRLLWGGSPEWAAQQIEAVRERPARNVNNTEWTVLEPLPNGNPPLIDEIAVSNARIPDLAAPMAAELSQPAALTRLNRRLDALDLELRAKLEAAMSQAWATIRRTATAQADRALKRLEPAMAATLDMDARDQLLAHLRANRYTAWKDARPMLAMLSVELTDSLDDAVADLELTLEQILIEHYDTLNSELAELGTEPEDLEQEIGDDQSNAAEAAILLIVASFTAWATDQLQGVDVGESPDDGNLPLGLSGTAATIAGGAVILDTAPDALLRSSEGRTVANSTEEWARRTVERFGAEGITGPNNRIVYLKTWVYGDPAARIRPFRPHLELDGEQWETDDEGDNILNGQFPQHHPRCQCQIRTEMRLVSN